MFLNKRNIFLNVLVSILFVLSFSSISAATYPLVNDSAGLLNDQDLISLQDMAEVYSNNYSQDIVLYTANGMDGVNIEDFGMEYFDGNGFGQGENASGIILLIDLEERDYIFLTLGNSEYLITDPSGFDYIENAVISDLSAGDYYSAFVAYYESVSYVLNYYESNGVAYGDNNSSSSSSNISSSNTIMNTIMGNDRAKTINERFTFSYFFSVARTVFLETIMFQIFLLILLFFFGYIYYEGCKNQTGNSSASSYVSYSEIYDAMSSQELIYTHTSKVSRGNGGSGGGGGGRSHGSRGGKF